MHVFSILLSVLVFSVILTTTSAQEGDEPQLSPVTEFHEGRHYHRISPAVATNVQAGAVEVLELFWYGCPHCYQFEKYLTSWKQDKPANVEFVRMPAVLNRGWVSHARAYYALETMGEIERIHPIFFEAMHAQGRGLRDLDSMARFLSQHAIDADEFKKAYDSLYVETKIKRSKELARQYGSSAVPTIVINGKYRTTATDAGGYEQILQVTNQLAQQEAKLIAQQPANPEKH